MYEMKVLGIIAEYNPFHNGHLYHLEESKRLSMADFVVCVMSGNFIQRGEPAIVNKWARAEMALFSGADLVVELPTVYAMASAEFFAFGAVKILDSLGIVDFICFGSERGSIGELEKIAEVLHQQPASFRRFLKEQLDRGLSFPAAREYALRRYFGDDSAISGDIEQIMGSSNSILGIEYLKALKRLGSHITPLTISRIGNEYNSEEITGSISSATAIRKLISDFPGRDFTSKLEKVLPPSSLAVLQREFKHGRGPVFPQNFDDIIIACARKMTAEQISSLPYVSEGLENRIKEAAGISGSFNQLIENISTKRYTRTRLQRSILSMLTGLTSTEFETFNKFGGPQYIRVLGFNPKGRQMLSMINKKATLPVIVKTANFKNSCNPLLRRMLDIESSATDMYVLGYSNPEFRKAGQEFTQNVIRVDVPAQAGCSQSPSQQL